MGPEASTLQWIGRSHLEPRPATTASSECLGDLITVFRENGADIGAMNTDMAIDTRLGMSAGAKIGHRAPLERSFAAE